MIIKLTKETPREDKPSSTLNTDSSSDESLSKLNLQCRIKDKSTQETMEKVDSEKQDNILDNTVDYNESATVKKLQSKPIPESTITTTSLASTRKDKKKDKRDLKKATKESLNYLNSPPRFEVIEAFKIMPFQI
jgi:hypothetical protein